MLLLVVADADMDADMIKTAGLQLRAIKYVDSEPSVQMIQDIGKHITELYALSIMRA